MLFKRYKNGYNAVIYVNDDSEKLVVLDANGNRAYRYTKDILEDCGYQNTTPEDTRYIHSGFPNKTITVPPSITNIKLVGQPSIYGHIEMEGGYIAIYGTVLTILNPNPFSPLIGREFVKQAAEIPTQTIALHINELKWETANDLFLFGEYGKEPLDNVKILDNVKVTDKYPIHVNMKKFNDYPIYAVDSDEKTFNFLKAKYMATSIYEFTKVMNRIIDDKSQVQAKDLIMLFDQDYITCNMTRQAFYLLDDFKECTQDYLHTLHTLEYFVSKLDVDFPVELVKQFYLKPDALDALKVILAAIKSVTDTKARYQLFAYTLMALHLPVVDLQDITYQDLITKLDKQFEERI